MRTLLLIALLAQTQPTSQSTQQPADNVRQAATPSEAIEAYARTGAPDTATKQAYIRKMIDLGAPDLAEAQAKDLVNAGVNDPMAIGVNAYLSAARGEIGAAVQQLRMALQQYPLEGFLLRTGGQLVAWYDGATDRSRLTATDVQALEWIRTTGAGKPAYVDAYRAAATPQTAPATAPLPSQESAEVPAAPPTIIYTTPSATYGSGYNYYPGYYPGYASYPIYTNPFLCYPHRSWNPVRVAPYGPVIHGRVPDRAPVITDRGARYGSSRFESPARRDNVRPAPTFRGSSTPMRSTPSQPPQTGRVAPYGPRR